jgi:hypothetical protein
MRTWIDYHYRPGQEAGNIPFVENAGFGKYSDNPIEIASIVSTWLSSPSLLESMQQAAFEASRPHATLDIAKDIANILFAKKMKKTNYNEQQQYQKRTRSMNDQTMKDEAVSLAINAHYYLT